MREAASHERKPNRPPAASWSSGGLSGVSQPTPFPRRPDSFQDGLRRARPASQATSSQRATNANSHLAEYGSVETAQSKRPAVDDEDLDDDNWCVEGEDEVHPFNGYGASKPDGTSPRLRAASAARPLHTAKARLMTSAALEHLEHLERLEQRTVNLPLSSDALDHSAVSSTGAAPVAIPPAHASNAQPIVPRRPRLNTQRLMQSARSPWAWARVGLIVIAVWLALVVGMSHMGEPSQPLMTSGFQSQVGSQANPLLTSLVQPEMQGKRPDLYDSSAQFNDWWGAACSAAVLSELLTAYGVPHITIGRMIDELGPDISPYGGLINNQGFAHIATKYGLRADYSSSLTYHQMLYITNTLGLPLIVNVRMAYGYYHFLSGGHFLVMTGGDQQGLRIVDSSEYYINYLPVDVFNSMFTGRTVVIVPASYQYTLPAQ